MHSLRNIKYDCSFPGLFILHLKCPTLFSAPLLPFAPPTDAIRALSQSTHYLHLSVYSECSWCWRQQNLCTISTFWPDYTASHLRRQQSSQQKPLHSIKLRPYHCPNLLNHPEWGDRPNSLCNTVVCPMIMERSSKKRSFPQCTIHFTKALSISPVFAWCKVF
jgi:hypothetical protein